MVERLTLLWVFRRSLRHPDVSIGFAHVTPAVAQELIEDDCAELAEGKDAKQLRYIEDGPPRELKKVFRKKIATKPARYKRRDMRPENGNGDD